MHKNKLFIAAGIGAALECYDFMICAFMASTLIALFFPDQTFLGVFAIFTIAFFSRPLGGLFWGHFGDRYGRRRVFSLTMLLLVVPTLGIALFPVHLGFAWFNAFGFMLLRFLQGFLVGGEFSGGVTFIAEIASSKNRGLTIASFMAALTIGTLLASMIALLLNLSFSQTQILAWAWRIPFLISVVLIGVAIYIRQHIVETPFFQSLQRHAKVSQIPLVDLLKGHFSAMLKGFILTSASAIALITLYLYLPQLFKQNPHFNARDLLSLTSLGTFLLVVMMPLGGFLADRFGRRIIFGVSMILTSCMLGFFYLALVQNNLTWLTVGMILASICFSGVNANYCALLSELFPTQVRFSGVALCYNLAYAVCGGVVPLLYDHFALRFGLLTLPVAFFVLVTFLSLLVLLRVEDQAARELR